MQLIGNPDSKNFGVVSSLTLLSLHVVGSFTDSQFTNNGDVNIQFPAAYSTFSGYAKEFQRLRQGE